MIPLGRVSCHCGSNRYIYKYIASIKCHACGREMTIKYAHAVKRMIDSLRIAEKWARSIEPVTHQSPAECFIESLEKISDFADYDNK